MNLLQGRPWLHWMCLWRPNAASFHTLSSCKLSWIAVDIVFQWLVPICGEQTGRPGFMQPQDKAKKKRFCTSKSNIDLISCIGFSFLLPEHESCIKGEADEWFGGAHTVKFRFFFLIFTLEWTEMELVLTHVHFCLCSLIFDIVLKCFND